MKVLFIAYFFPPIGGGGVQRSAKFVKYLPQFGFTPLVVTAGTAETEHWAPKDEALMRDLPPEARVFRAGKLPPVTPPRTWNQRFRDVLGRATPFGQAWTQAILRLGARVCREEKPDLIYVSLSPWEGAAAAAQLARQFKLPWVADLRDPWALDEMQIYMSGLHRRLVRQQMRRTLRTANLVIMNTPEAARQLKENFPEYRNRRVIHLTNGYDAEDFESLVHHPDPEHFRIVHTGSLHTRIGHLLARRRRLFEAIGRVSAGVDFLTRSHEVLLQALNVWRTHNPEAGRQARLILAGSLTAEDRALAEHSDVRDMVTIDRYRSHPETIQLQKDAELLFLPMHDLPVGHRATIVPGKTYEYLATGRPILAAVPDGDARDFVENAGTGLLCRPGDVEGMTGLLERQYRAWRAGQPAPTPNLEFIRSFERRHLTERLAEEFDRLLGSTRGRRENNLHGSPAGA